MRSEFQDELTRRAKALRQEHAQSVLGVARRPVWLKRMSKKGERVGGGAVELAGRLVCGLIV